MKSIIQISFLISVLVLSLSFSPAQPEQTIPAGISTALKTGNSRQLGSFFNIKIELVLMRKADVYSKNQAEIIIKDFFRKHKPSNFELQKVGVGRNHDSKFAVGKLTTHSGTFRVIMLLRIRRGKHYIHQFRIERENG